MFYVKGNFSRTFGFAESSCMRMNTASFKDEVRLDSVQLDEDPPGGNECHSGRYQKKQGYIRCYPRVELRRRTERSDILFIILHTWAFALL